jgi:hypothetical protein
MDVKPISVVAIKPSVDSGGRERSPQQFADAEHKDDRDDEQFADQIPDDTLDIPLTDAPELAPELPAPPQPGRYVNKVV